MTRTDKAGREYWDALWTSAAEGDAKHAAAHDHHHDDVITRRFAEKLRATFPPERVRGQRLIEIGCARSPWLARFAREFGFRVSGLDYSAIGCAQTRERLAAEGVEADIVCADLFAPPEALLGTFDVVCSFGVVEHFDDTAEALRAMARLLAPGGRIFTSVPNLAGLLGTIQKHAHRPVYDVHVPLDREALEAAHRAAGLVVEEASYFQSTNFNICHLTGAEVRFPLWHAKRVSLALLGRASRVAWAVEDRVGPLPTSRLLSPYVICVARNDERHE